MDSEELQYPYPLLIIAGKGGVGKTVLTAALGSEAAKAGHSTLVVELGGQRQLPRLLGDPSSDPKPDADGIVRLDENLGWTTLSPDRLLAGWLSGRNMGLIADRLESSGALSVVASSIPGIKDVLVLGHLRSTLESGSWDRIIVDGPASGRAREMVRTPRQLAEATEEGPVASQAERANALLTDPARCALLLVTLPEETPVNETIETAFDVEDDPGIHLAGVVTNRVFPLFAPPASLAPHPLGRPIGERYAREQEQIARLEGELPVPNVRIPERANGFRQRSDVDEFRHEGAASRLDGEPEPFESADASVLDDVMARHIVVAVGTGGVGKTSVAAAVALRAAAAGRSVALITIDPARRLADALGLDELGDELTEIGLTTESAGQLHATMLDSRETFGRVIRRHAHTDQQADQILASPLSSQLADALAGMTEYMAVERLYELTREPEIDLIVVDTPPSADALAFLYGPTLLTKLLDNRIYRLLVHEGRRRNIVQRAIGGLVGQLISIVGGAVINDAVTFFRLFDGMEEGFRQRSGEIHDLLRSDETSVVVVASPAGRSLDNALDFDSQLRDEGVQPRLAIANRCTPDPGDPVGDSAADALLDHLRIRRSGEQQRLTDYADRAGVPVLSLDELSEPITDLNGVAALAEELDGC